VLVYYPIKKESWKQGFNNPKRNFMSYYPFGLAMRDQKRITNAWATNSKRPMPLLKYYDSLHIEAIKNA